MSNHRDDAIAVMIARHGLPPRIKLLYDTMVAAGLDVSSPPEEGLREVAQLKLLVDGDRLISALLATFVGAQALAMPEDDEGFSDDEPAEGEADEGEAGEGEGEAPPPEPEQAGQPPMPPAIEDSGADARVPDGAAFDHDGDGKVGGSKPRKKAAPKKS